MRAIRDKSYDDGYKRGYAAGWNAVSGIYVIERPLVPSPSLPSPRSMTAGEVNSAALYDALECAANAVLLAEDDTGDPGRARRAQEALWEAAVAASGAFPLSSPQSDALHVILGAVGELLPDPGVTA